MTTQNEAAERLPIDPLHQRQDWRVEQEPAYLLRTDKADGTLDRLSRAEFSDLLDAALAAERRATVEQCLAAFDTAWRAFDGAYGNPRPKWALAKIRAAVKAVDEEAAR